MNKACCDNCCIQHLNHIGLYKSARKKQGNTAGKGRSRKIGLAQREQTRRGSHIAVYAFSFHIAVAVLNNYSNRWAMNFFNRKTNIDFFCIPATDCIIFFQKIENRRLRRFVGSSRDGLEADAELWFGLADPDSNPRGQIWGLMRQTSAPERLPAKAPGGG